MRYCVLFLLLIATGCSKNECDAPFPEEFSAFYYNVDGDLNLLDRPDIYDALEIYYFDGSNDKKVLDYLVFKSLIDMDAELFISLRRSITEIAGSGVKEFYFEMDNMVDTLYVDVNSFPHPECNGYLYEYVSVLFNGMPATQRENHLEDMSYELFSNKH